MVLNLHKFEPPQIKQPSFTCLTALLHTLHLLHLGSKCYLHSQLRQFHCYLKKEKAFPVIVGNYYWSFPRHYSENYREDGVYYERYRVLCNSWGPLSPYMNLVANISIILWQWLPTVISVRNGGSKFLIKDTRYKATFYFCCDKKKSHILQIKCRTLKYWHILLSCTMLRFSYDSL